MRRSTETSLLAPLIVVAAVAMMAFLACFVIWSKEIDRGALLREEDLVDRGVEARMKEVETAIFAETNWDEAVANLDTRFDVEWARQYLTAYFAQVDNFDGVFVLDGADRPIYASTDGEDAPTSAYAAFVSAAPLVAEVRRLEAQRGPLTKPAAGKEPIAGSIQKSSFLRGPSGLHLVTASLVQPDFGRSLPSARADRRHHPAGRRDLHEASRHAVPAIGLPPGQGPERPRGALELHPPGRWTVQLRLDAAKARRGPA